MYSNRYVSYYIHVHVNVHRFPFGPNQCINIPLMYMYLPLHNIINICVHIPCTYTLMCMHTFTMSCTHTCTHTLYAHTLIYIIFTHIQCTLFTHNCVYPYIALCISGSGLGLCPGSLLWEAGPLPDQWRDHHSTNTAEHIHSDAGSSGPAHSTQGVGGANIHHNDGLLDQVYDVSSHNT